MHSPFYDFFMVYYPSGYGNKITYCRAILWHGCHQTSEEFALGVIYYNFWADNSVKIKHSDLQYHVFGKQPVVCPEQGHLSSTAFMSKMSGSNKIVTLYKTNSQQPSTTPYQARFWKPWHTSSWQELMSERKEILFRLIQFHYVCRNQSPKTVVCPVGGFLHTYADWL